MKEAPRTYTIRTRPEKLPGLLRMRRAIALPVNPRPWESVENGLDTEHWDPFMFEELLDSFQFHFKNLSQGNTNRFLKKQ